MLKKRWQRLIAGTLFGYVIAVLVAATVAVAILAFTQIKGLGQLVPVARQVPQIWLVGVAFTAMTAWPGYLLTVSIAHWKTIESWLFFGLCGIATACLAIWILEGWDNPRSVDFAWMIRNLGEIWFALPGGFVGALGYAWFHRRWFSVPAPSKSLPQTH